jgi:hypothetical protein
VRGGPARRRAALAHDLIYARRAGTQLDPAVAEDFARVDHLRDLAGHGQPNAACVATIGCCTHAASPSTTPAMTAPHRPGVVGKARPAAAVEAVQWLRSRPAVHGRERVDALACSLDALRAGRAANPS